ncbi:MAG: exodeoxyribonuclease VII large subunit [Gammaproteobacteria bacterium]|nr:MAG: exodeoxyribonuclease VII large subunit [Gammaproteobacteria bacterium]
MPEVSEGSPQRDVYSVARLNREARELLESGFQRLWVEGEISNLARPASGHLYFTLKDARAQVSCALFRNRAIRLSFTPENGTQVLIQAQVSLYEARGNYQLIVNHMEEAGDGALRRAFEQLKNQLQREGLFDAEHKRALPDLPHCIGVITSPSGAAIRDVLTILKRRFPAIPVIIYPTLVQGEGAARQIVSAIHAAETRAECDVLLLTRGGGSLEDLWPFNEEAVARAVYTCQIPVVSAVGHEIDFVISDFVADQRAATPSAGAELLSPDQNEIASLVRHLENRLQTHTRRHLQSFSDRLGWLVKRISQTHPGRQLQQQAQRLDELEARLGRSRKFLAARQQSRLDTIQSRLAQCSPQQQLQRLLNQATQLAQRLEYCINTQVSYRREKLAVLSRALDAISPLATLQRGYSITLLQADGSVVHSVQQVRNGDTLETRLASGRILSKVTGTDSS